MLKCCIPSNTLKKYEYKIRYNDTDDWNQNMTKLLSQISKKFKFLSELDYSQWTLCINSQFIDKQNAQQFCAILSSIPSNNSKPVIVKIVRPTPKDDDKKNNHQFAPNPKYIITIHHNNQQFEYALSDESKEWDDVTFESLQKAVANRFNISGSFEMLTKDSNVDLDDIECIQDEFDSLKDSNTIHIVLQVKSVSLRRQNTKIK